MMTEETPPLTPELLLSAYAQGYFPMAEHRDDPTLYWFSPSRRGILPLETFHIPARLKKRVRAMPYRISVDEDFHAVITACAEAPRPRDGGTWINDTIIEQYTSLHQLGHAHSVECWQQDTLVGGLYGVSIGGAFCGESMFSRADDASKIALVALVAILRASGYTLLDTQYINDHLLQFGAEEIPQADYLARLKNALSNVPNPSTRFSTVSGTILSASSLPDSLILFPSRSSRS